MSYTSANFRTKKALKDAVAAGRKISVYEPGLGPTPRPGDTVYLEGPHYPEPHRWYAKATLGPDGFIAVGSIK